MLYINQEEQIGKRLIDRLQLLTKNVREKPSFLEFVKHWSCDGTGSRSLRECLKESLESGYEGLMVKNLNSTYTPGLRNKDWIKLKPDYLDSLALEIDALIVGACPGRMKSNSSLGLSTFTCAVKETTNQWCIISRVGSGFNAEELGSLAHDLEPFLEPFTTRASHSWLCGEPLKAALRPKYIVTDRLKRDDMGAGISGRNPRRELLAKIG